MAQSGPMSLKQVKEILQQAIDKGDHSTAEYYMKILERFNIRVSYDEVTEEDKISDIKSRVKEILMSKGVTRADATFLINDNPIKINNQNEMNRYIEDLYRKFIEKQSNIKNS